MTKFQVARHADGRWQPYFIVEVMETSDGPRSRICDGHFNAPEVAAMDVKRRETIARSLDLLTYERVRRYLGHPHPRSRPTIQGDPVPPWGIHDPELATWRELAARRVCRHLDLEYGKDINSSMHEPFTRCRSCGTHWRGHLSSEQALLKSPIQAYPPPWPSRENAQAEWLRRNRRNAGFNDSEGDE